MGCVGNNVGRGGFIVAGACEDEVLIDAGKN